MHFDNIFVSSCWWCSLGLSFRISSWHGRVTITALETSANFLQKNSTALLLPIAHCPVDFWNKYFAQVCYRSSLLHSLPASNISLWSSSCFWIFLCRHTPRSCCCHLASFPQVAFNKNNCARRDKKENIFRAGLTDPVLAVGVPIYIIWLTSTISYLILS